MISLSSRRRRFQSNNNYIDNLTIVKRVLQILIVIFLLIFIYSSIKMKKNVTKQNLLAERITNTETSESSDINTHNEQNTTIENNIDSENTKKPKSTTINMAFTGDIMCHNTIYKDAYDSENASYNFSYIFDEIKYNIQTADVSIGNLETTFSGSSNRYSSYPKFNTPESLAFNLKKLGFDVLTTANNHCLDYGYSGLESTINYLDEADIAHTGTFKSEEDQNKILIQNV